MLGNEHQLIQPVTVSECHPTLFFPSSKHKVESISQFPRYRCTWPTCLWQASEQKNQNKTKQTTGAKGGVRTPPPPPPRICAWFLIIIGWLLYEKNCYFLSRRSLSLCCGMTTRRGRGRQDTYQDLWSWWGKSYAIMFFRFPHIFLFHLYLFDT